MPLVPLSAPAGPKKPVRAGSITLSPAFSLMLLPRANTNPPHRASAARLACALLGLLSLSLPALAQPEPFIIDLDYTRTTGTGTPNLRRVTVEFTPTPAPALTLSLPITVASLNGADGLTVMPDTRLLVGGQGNRVHQVYPAPALSSAVAQVTTVAAVAAIPGPNIANIVLDPSPARAWAFAPSSSQVIRVPLSPNIASGTAFNITGPDSAVSHIAFAGPRVFYVAPGTGPGMAVLGTIDLTTFATTRLLSGLAAGEQVRFDPHTGHLLVFGNTSIIQIDPAPAVPTIVSTLDLSSINPALGLRSGTPDGNGRVFALGASGQLVFIDYSASGLISHATNTVLVAALEPGIEDVIPLVGAGGAARSHPDCLWNNGEFDDHDGLASAIGPAHGGNGGPSRTADDFYLCPGFHRIDAIGATMFTDSLLPSAKIEVYDDCGGKPGALIGSFAATVTDTGNLFAGLRVFDLRAATPNLWLRGEATYWVSPVGIGSALGTDEWFFGTSNQGVIQGTPARFHYPAAGVVDWTSVSEFGCGCTDFAFTVEGASCKTLRDNGTPDPSGACSASIVNNTSADIRTADNFVVPPCDDRRVCFIQSYLYTNCIPARGLFELYADSCRFPTGAPLFSAPFSLIVDLGYNVVVNSNSLRAYRVEAHNLDWPLAQGRNYWLSVVGLGNGGFNQRACWPANVRCDMPQGGACNISIRQGAITGPGVGLPTTWAKVQQVNGSARDFAFLIAVRHIDSESSAAPGPGGGDDDANPCPADFDRSGVPAVADIFAFLAAWFSGCP